MDRLEFFSGFSPATNSSDQVQVGVHQQFYNLVVGNSSLLDNNIFNMTTCPSHTGYSADSVRYNPLSIHI